MDKIFIVKANFSDFESSWSKIIGVFTDEEISKKHESKWISFFEYYKDIFSKPNEWAPNEEDIEWDVDDWYESSEYYQMKMKYEMIYDYDSVTIEEIPLNKDNFICDGYHQTESMKSLMTQWDRDFKINDINKLGL